MIHHEILCYQCFYEVFTGQVRAVLFWNANEIVVFEKIKKKIGLLNDRKNFSSKNHEFKY